MSILHFQCYNIYVVYIYIENGVKKRSCKKKTQILYKAHKGKNKTEKKNYWKFCYSTNRILGKNIWRSFGRGKKNRSFKNYMVSHKRHFYYMSHIEYIQKIEKYYNPHTTHKSIICSVKKKQAFQLFYHSFFQSTLLSYKNMLLHKVERWKKI